MLICFIGSQIARICCMCSRDAGKNEEDGGSCGPGTVEHPKISTSLKDLPAHITSNLVVTRTLTCLLLLYPIVVSQQ